MEVDSLFKKSNPLTSLGNFNLNESRISLFPNPATKVLNIQNLNIPEGAILQTINTEGQIMDQNVILDNSSIDASLLKPALYAS